jgi:hypothetical protein
MKGRLAVTIESPVLLSVKEVKTNNTNTAATLTQNPANGQWAMQVNAIKAGIDSLDIFDAADGSCIRFASAHVVKPVSIKTSTQYVADAGWDQSVGWAHTPAEAMDKVNSRLSSF